MDKNAFMKTDSMTSEMKWNEYFFELAKTISTKSKDSTKIGCLIEKDHSIISTGYNGFPVGVIDSPFLKGDPEKPIEINPRLQRPLKYFYTAHAEENAIAFAARNGVSTLNSSIYIYGMAPCSRCARLIIQAGIKHVYAIMAVTKDSMKRWEEEMDITVEMFEESGIFYNFFEKTT